MAAAPTRSASCAGCVWKLGYLLCGLLGIGKTSLIVAIANLLEFDIYDLKLNTVGSTGCCLASAPVAPSIIVMVFVYIQQFKGWDRGFAAGAGVVGLAVIVFIVGMPRYRLTTVQGDFEGGGGSGDGRRGRR